MSENMLVSTEAVRSLVAFLDALRPRDPDGPLLDAPLEEARRYFGTKLRGGWHSADHGAREFSRTDGVTTENVLGGSGAEVVPDAFRPGGHGPYPRFVRVELSVKVTTEETDGQVVDRVRARLANPGIAALPAEHGEWEPKIHTVCVAARV